MKKIVITAAVLCFAAITTSVSAQDDKVIEKEKKQTQEIIIRKKGEKDTKFTVEIKGDKVTINGKPLSEFKDDEITINRRNITIRDGKGKTRMELSPGDIEGLSFFNDANSDPRAFLGVTTEDTEGGAKITAISKGSAAEKAGLKEGDIITKVADKKVDGPETLSEVVTSMKPKDEVTVSYKRDGKENSAKAILGEKKGSDAMSYSFSGPDGMTRSYTIPRTPRTPGAPRIQSIPRVEMWNDKEFGNGENFNFYGDMFTRQQRLGLKIQDTEEANGVKVLDVENDSPAEKAGLKKDDIIIEIGGKKIINTDQMREQLHENHDKAAYNIKATRNGSTMSFDIKIQKKLKTANL